MGEAMAMNESIVTIDEDNFPISKTLLAMGISVKNQNYGTRLRGALDNFNACYLETMDFLNQILPLAKHHFAKHDAILLPKTPAKKRTRKKIQTIQPTLDDITEHYSPPSEDIEVSDQTRVNETKRSLDTTDVPGERVTRASNTERSLDTTNVPEKRITRNSKSKKSLETTDIPAKRVTRGSKSKVKLQTEDQSVDKENVEPDIASTVEKTETEASKKVVRRSRSMSNGNKRSTRQSKRKSSKQSTKSKIDKSDSLNIEKPEANNNKEPLPVKNSKRSRSGSPTISSESKRSKSGESLHVTVEDNVSMQVDVSEDNWLVECTEPTSKKNVEIEMVSESEIPIIRVENIVGNNTKNSPKTESNEGGTETTKPESVTNMEVLDTNSEEKDDVEMNHQIKCVDTGEVNGKKRKSEEIDDESPIPMLVENGQQNPSPCVMVAESPDLVNNKETALDNADDSVVAPSPIETKIFSTPENALPAKISETQNIGSTSETTIPEDNTIAGTNNQPFVRRSSRRSSRCISSKLSMGKPGKRRSSRRLSRRSSVFKKPQIVKHVEAVISMSSESDSAMDVSPVRKEHSPHDSDDEPKDEPVGPTSSTPDFDKPRRSLRLLGKTSIMDEPKHIQSSSSDENCEPNVGKVAGMIQDINKKNNKVVDKHASGSINGTPNRTHGTPGRLNGTLGGTGSKRVKRIGSSVKHSSTKPSNIVGGNVRSFIKRQSTKKLDANEVVRLKKLELQRKEEKEKERLDQAELRRKNWADEQKRKREEKQKRVTEAKAARDKEEQEKKVRQLEDRKQLLQALEQAKKKKEQEEENKKRLREQRKKEADARRLKENEERLKKLHEKEEEEKVYREMLKRKQEHEEQERKQRILEEKRLHEQKQRERQREQAEERERKLREIKEKQEEKNREEAEKREKERKLRENEDREKKRIAQLIKEKMEQDKAQWEEKRQREEKERREREEQRKKLQASKPNQASTLANKSAHHTESADSYLMTPPPAQTRKPPTNENYDISDIRSDESTDDEECPRKKVPAWAQGAALKMALLHQAEPRRLFTVEAGPCFAAAPNLEEIFTKKRRRFYQRTSSAHWDTPPLKKVY